ncbi:MAG: hypothetical protein QM687_09645 [Ferruginibacter sp.]
MLKRLLPAAIIGYVLLIIVNWGCTKLDTTKLGSDLIPAVDNVYTFSDTFPVITTQGIFNDTFKINKTMNNVLGAIDDDHLIGATNANIYFQVKPGFFPFYFGNAGDTILPTVDSVVLCLNFAGMWGDSSKPQSLRVSTINQKSFSDSPYNYHYISYQPTLGNVVGNKNVDIRTLKDTIRTRGDSMTNQIRIKLDQTFAQELFSTDSLPTGTNNFFRTDSLFRSKFHGFAVEGLSGNALMYISLTDTRTRLEVHYKCKRKNTGKLDTTSTYFYVNSNDFGSILPSATSNYINRSYSSQVTNPASDYLYLITGPGTYANLRIPALDTLSNRIIHRAEIYFEHAPDIAGGLNDSIFSPPPYMYLDLVDTGATKWKPIYHDLNPGIAYDPDYKTAGLPYYPGSVDFSYFGGFSRKGTNLAGQPVTYYSINISRHVQRIITQHTPNYTFRLFPAYSLLYPQYTNATSIAYDNPLAYGRVRIKSGSYSLDPRLRMRMVIIWSKI